MKSSTVCLALFAALSTLQSGQADQSLVYVPWGQEIGFVQHSTILLSDEVTDNCWTNSSTIKSKLHLIFEQNDVKVLDYDPAFFDGQTVETEISAFGYRTTNGLCAVSASFNVQTTVSTEIGGFEGKQKFSARYVTSVFRKASIFTIGTNTNLQLTEFFEGAASEFIARVLAARRSMEVVQFFSVYPPSGELPMSKAVWEKLLIDMREARQKSE